MIKKMSLIAVIAAALLAGCESGTTPAPEAPKQTGSEQTQPGEAKPNEPEQNQPGDAKQGEKTPEQNQEQKPAEKPGEAQEKSFQISLLNAKDLSKGIFTGIEFHYGSKFKDMVNVWGKPDEISNLRGGEYYLYQKEDYVVYFFDPSAGDSVSHIQLVPTKPITMDEIRKQLGKPNVDELDEMMEGTWSMLYPYGDFTLFVVGKTESRNSEVNYMFLKYEGE